MTVAELYQWAYVRNWGRRKVARLEEQMRRYLNIPFDAALCKEWAGICVHRQRLGHPISVQDAWIAATALRHDCPLVTHNRADFVDIPGLEIISQG
jgi:tRNA(fMet)-specific endonuclease VapC